MTSVRRVLGAGGAVLVGLLLVAPPAPAAEGDPTIEWTRPTAGDVYLRAPDALTGTVNGAEGDKISKLEFELTPVGAPEGEGDPCRAAIPDDKKTMSFSPAGSLPLDFELPVDVPCNRRYRVTATITRQGTLGGPICGLGVDCQSTTPPFEFAVAIKPVKVTGLAASAYDPGTKQVKLTWGPLDPRPPDFLRYEVYIDPPGEGTANSKVLFADGPSFDYTVADGDQGPHNFRVRAVREGPDDTGNDATEFGPASDNVQAGPEAPPGQPPADQPSGGFNGPSAPKGKAPKPTTRTTVDTGFNKSLPFDPSQTTTVPPTSSTAGPPPEDAAVLAIDDNRDQDTRRATVVPVAGGLVLLLGAAHLRLLSKRAEEPEIPIRSR